MALQSVFVTHCATLCHIARKEARRHLSARVTAAVLDELDRRARRARKPRSNLVEQYLAEALKLEAHPGIAFADGPTGRRAVLASRRGLDIWQIITTLQDNHGSAQATADVLGLSETDVRTAISYYVANRAEIDDEIRAHHESSDAAYATWRREQALLR